MCSFFRAGYGSQFVKSSLDVVIVYCTPTLKRRTFQAMGAQGQNLKNILILPPEQPLYEMHDFFKVGVQYTITKYPKNLGAIIQPKSRTFQTMAALGQN
jgi:hypothetical protein